MSFAEPRQWVDVESPVREWARDNVAGISRRVFFGPSERAAYPQVVLQRIAGPDDRCLIQFDVWGAPKGGKASVATVAAELATAADALSRYVHDGVLLHGALVEGTRWQPDPESDQPRYIVDVTVFATAAFPSPA